MVKPYYMPLLVHYNGFIDTFFFFGDLTDDCADKGPGGEHLSGQLTFG